MVFQGAAGQKGDKGDSRLEDNLVSLMHSTYYNMKNLIQMYLNWTDLDNSLVGPDYLFAWPTRASWTPWACCKEYSLLLVQKLFVKES